MKFSEQEMTDCYNNGCEGGDFRMVRHQFYTVEIVKLKNTY